MIKNHGISTRRNLKFELSKLECFRLIKFNISLNDTKFHELIRPAQLIVLICEILISSITSEN